MLCPQNGRVFFKVTGLTKHSPSYSAAKPGASSAKSGASFRSWAALVRLPNVFTVIADVTAAFCLVVGGHGGRASDLVHRTETTIGLALAAMAGVALYWGGMILNDLFDVKRDIRSRRARPLTTRAISVSQARAVAIGLLLLGILFPIGIASLSPSVDPIAAWTPAIVSVMIVVCIVLYDGPLKRKPVAPILMGGCRLLSFLLGATAATAVNVDETGRFAIIALGDPVWGDVRCVTLAFAVGMGTYITGITTFGRREAVGDRTIHLPVGLVLMTIGAGLIAFSPRLGRIDGERSWTDSWSVDPVWIFPAAIGLMVATTIFQGVRAATNPSPIAIQSTIRSALLAIIPIAAAITMLGVGATPAIAVFAMMLPSTWLAQRFRMT